MIRKIGVFRVETSAAELGVAFAEMRVKYSRV